jgi:hypothetical protein
MRQVAPPWESWAITNNVGETPNNMGCNNVDQQGDPYLEASLEPQHAKIPTTISSPTVEQEQHTETPLTFSSPMKTSILWPKNSAD